MESAIHLDQYITILLIPVLIRIYYEKYSYKNNWSIK